MTVRKSGDGHRFADGQETFSNLWCGEGDLFSCTALIPCKLYTSRRGEIPESSTRTRPSHTASHTDPPRSPGGARGG